MMSYLQQREERIQMFEETIRFCRENRKLAGAIRETMVGTSCYDNSSQLCTDNGNGWKNTSEFPRVLTAGQDVVTMVQQGMREFPRCRIGVLNLGAGTNPGGMVLQGGAAQEESLCRCSTLYPCLRTQEGMKRFYGRHRQGGDSYYTDICMYTPGIVGIRKGDRQCFISDERDWYVFDVITCSAPYVRRKQTDGSGEECCGEKVQEVLERRIQGMLEVALFQGIEVCVMVCGMQEDSRYIVQSAWNNALKNRANFFKAIGFVNVKPSGI